VQQVEAMKQMVNAFSDYARAPAMELVNFDLNQLVNEVADGYTKARLTADLWSALQTSNMVRTLNLLLVANLPDARLDR